MQIGIYRFADCVNDKHRLFANDQELKKYCKDSKANWEKWQQKKFDIGLNGSDAVNEASSGIFKQNKSPSTPRKKPPSTINPFGDAYDLHKGRGDAKDQFAKERLALGQQQLKLIGNIGRSIAMASRTDNDYWALFNEYVRMDFEPKSESLRVRTIARRHKEEAILLQRAFEMNPDRYDATLKNKRIIESLKEWQQMDRYEYRERDRTSVDDNHNRNRK